MKSIFVGNLAFNTTEDDLRSLLQDYSTVERVNIVTDRDTGRSRGFAFVEMGDNEEAEAAIAALNGYELDGRALRVNEALPKGDSRGPRAGGGGGRPGGGGGGGGGGRSRGRREPRW